MMRRPPRSTPFPYTSLSRSIKVNDDHTVAAYLKDGAVYTNAGIQLGPLADLKQPNAAKPVNRKILVACCPVFTIVAGLNAADQKLAESLKPSPEAVGLYRAD